MARIQHSFALIVFLLLNGVQGFAPAKPVASPRLVSWHPTLKTTSGRTNSRPSSSSFQPRGVVQNSQASSTLEKGRKWLFLPSSKLHPFTSTALLIVLDVVFRQVFRRAKIRFPSSLAGCGVLLVALLVAQQRQSDPNEPSLLYQQLQPGAALLAQWLPVFFVPSLVSLPLAAGLGSVSDLIKVTVVLVLGFLFTLYSTAYAVVAVQNIKGSATVAITEEGAPKEESSVNNDSNQESKAASSSPLPKPFSSKLLSQLTLWAASTGLLSVGFVGAKASQYLTGLCFLTSTLASFVFGARLPVNFTKWVHPLVTCTSLTWSVVAVLAGLTGHSFRHVLKMYRTGSLWTGAGDVLLFLLGPAVVSLAVSMFDRRRLVREHAAAVATAVGVATVGGVGGTALAVRLVGIGMPAVRLSLLSRNITSPLAMAMAALVGGDVSLAVSMVVITGLIGANFGARLLSAVGITNPVARGLGMGAAAHGLGTAALARSEPEAFSFSAIAMALVAAAATVTVSIPVLRRVVLELALG